MPLKLVHSKKITEADRELERAQMACARDEWDKAAKSYEKVFRLVKDEDEKGEVAVCIAYCHLNKGRIQLADKYMKSGIAQFASKDKQQILLEAYSTDKRNRANQARRERSCHYRKSQEA